MPETQFETLRLELLRGGVAPVYIERTLDELGEHYVDLEAAALASGATPAEAAVRAHEALGTAELIAAAVLARPELLAWNKRWPRVAHCLESAAAIGAAPGIPLVYCMEHRPELARWGAALGVAAVFVSGILTTLAWLIAV